MGGGEGLGHDGKGDVFVEADGEGVGGGLGGRLGDSEGRRRGCGLGGLRRGGDGRWDEDWGGCGGLGGELVEFEEELVLGVGDGLGVEGGDLGGGLGLADGALGFGGEEGAVALGVGVALGDGSGDAGGAGFGGRGWSDGRERCCLVRACGGRDGRRDARLPVP